MTPNTLEAAGLEALQARALEVAEWLDTLPATFASPHVVRIGRSVYPGAFYLQTRKVLSGCAAYARGERSYVQRGLYLLGNLPASYRRSSMTAYQVEPAGTRYFVAGWYDHDDPNEWHPFGRMFQLFPDDHTVTTCPDGRPYPHLSVYLIG